MDSAIALIVSALTGTIAWELVNPITMLQRGLVFGVGFAWVVVLAVFVFDLAVSRRGWCSYLCPVGAFYGIAGKASLVRVSAVKRHACTDCGDCFRVCPEPHVISPALKPADADIAGRAARRLHQLRKLYRRCEEIVFRFSTRFGGLASSAVSRE